MRVTACSRWTAVDVDVDDGVPAGRLRARLARLTGDGAWVSAGLFADGVPLPDAHPTGRPPLVHGATVRPEPGPLPEAVLAARAELHIAVVAGLEAGRLLVPPSPGPDDPARPTATTPPHPGASTAGPGGAALGPAAATAGPARAVPGPAAATAGPTRALPGPAARAATPGSSARTAALGPPARTATLDRSAPPATLGSPTPTMAPDTPDTRAPAFARSPEPTATLGPTGTLLVADTVPWLVRLSPSRPSRFPELWDVIHAPRLRKPRAEVRARAVTGRVVLVRRSRGGLGCAGDGWAPSAAPGWRDSAWAPSATAGSGAWASPAVSGREDGAWAFPATTWRGGSGRARRVPRWRSVRWRVGDELRAGATVLVLRSRPGSTRPAKPPHRWWEHAARLAPGLAGALTAAALAVTLRQPVLALGALSALLLVGRQPAPPPTPLSRPDDEPADLATLRVAMASGLPPPAVAAGVPWDGDLAVVGPRAPALAAARGLLLSVLSAASPRIAVHTDRPEDWQWLTWCTPRPHGVASPRLVGPGDAGLVGPVGAGLVDQSSPRLVDRGGLGLVVPGSPGPTHPGDPGLVHHSNAGLVHHSSPGLVDPGDAVVVLDGPYAADASADGGRVLRLPGGDAPGWSRAVLEVDGRRARWREAGGAWQDVAFVGVGDAVAEQTARGLGAAARLAAVDGVDGLPLDRCPPDVVLGGLPGIPAADPAAVARAWRAASGLVVPLGAGPAGAPVLVDLVADGPHALVAGTTGSGKSQLLLTLVVALAATHPPDRLAVLLVDFKGGTGLGALAGLPHVVGHLSDLDAAGARRTLRGLAAELRRRERVLTAHGASDVRHLDPAAAPPRLVVVIDEFRVLADELPDLLGTLARLAAQGRSLGVHLVLATQRPAGAVPADLRANVALRVVLRVADAADSVDLVGVGDAARIARPGLALLVRGAGRPEPVQVARAAPRRRANVRLAQPLPGAWVPAAELSSAVSRVLTADPSSGGTYASAANPPSGRAWVPAANPPSAGAWVPAAELSSSGVSVPEADPESGSVLVSRAGPSAARAWVPRARSSSAGAMAPSHAGAGDDADAAVWVDAIRGAAAGRTRAVEPWLPPLPELVRVADVPAGPGLPLALADLPDELTRGPVRWNPDTGHLLVVGGPGSGRSTALAAVAAAGLTAGRAVHAVGLPRSLRPSGLASALDAADVTRVARLVRLLAGAPPDPGPRPLLVLDDVAGALAELAGLARGAPAELLEHLWAAAGGPCAVAAGGALGPATARIAPGFADRLVLGSPDPSADPLAGVPADLAGPRPTPGRAVHLGRGRAVLCQVALPDEPAPGGDVVRDTGGPAGPPGLSASPSSLARPAAPSDQPAPPSPLARPAGPSVSPLPSRVLRPPEVPAVTAAGVALGIGGDAAGVIRVALDRPLLVVGPPGSGRTSALETLAHAHAGTGGLVVWPATPTPAIPPGALVVVDDLDEVEAADAALADALVALLTGDPPPRFVAATTTAHAVAAFRGLVPALLRVRRLLVLDPAEPGGADLLGPEGAWLVDRRRPPGRAALRLGREVTPLQLWAPQ